MTFKTDPSEFPIRPLKEDFIEAKAYKDAGCPADLQAFPGVKKHKNRAGKSAEEVATEIIQNGSFWL